MFIITINLFLFCYSKHLFEVVQGISIQLRTFLYEIFDLMNTLVFSAKEVHQFESS